MYYVSESNFVLLLIIGYFCNSKLILNRSVEGLIKKYVNLLLYP